MTKGTTGPVVGPVPTPSPVDGHSGNGHGNGNGSGGHSPVVGPPPVLVPEHKKYFGKLSERDFILLVSLLVVELAFTIWAVILAWKCGGKHEDRIVHLVFAFFFPFFYLLYYFISGCGNYKGCDRVSFA